MAGLVWDGVAWLLNTDWVRGRVTDVVKSPWVWRGSLVLLLFMCSKLYLAAFGGLWWLLF